VDELEPLLELMELMLDMIEAGSKYLVQDFGGLLQILQYVK
jgi:hypothetical protein